MSGHKILFFIPYGHGGVETFCKTLLNHLHPDFHTELLEVANQPDKNLIIKSFDVIHNAHRLINRLRTSDYDVIHINPSFKINSLLRDSFYLWIIDRFNCGNRTVVFFHGWDGYLAQRIIRNPLYKRALAKIYGDVGIVFVLYNRCKEQLVDIGVDPQKIKVTTTTYEAPPADSSLPTPHSSLFTFHFSLPPTVNILFMSRFIEGKGTLTVGKIARRLVENGYHHVKFTFAGDGPLLPALKAFVAENGLDEYVEIPGYVSGSEKAEVLRKGDIFLFPTQLPEGCPVAIIEAMGAGQAIVSTPKGAIPDLVKDGENGFICDGQAFDALYEAVKTLLDNQELRHEIQERNRKKAEENYEARDYTTRMEGVYLSLKATAEADSNPIEFLDFPLHAYSMEETVEHILTNISDENVVNHMSVNAAKLVYGKKNPILREAILKSHLINADGQSIVWGSTLLGKKIPERVAGIDLFFRLLSEFEKRGVPVYFLGSTDDVLNRMIAQVEQDYPKLTIAGYRNGYFPEEADGQICDMINRSKAQALFLGISSPKKEIFLLKNSSRLTPTFRMGVGGSFDILAGHTKRAPRFVQKMGFEWLYRIYQEPRRMWKRYAVTNTLYAYYLIQEAFRLKK